MVKNHTTIIIYVLLFILILLGVFIYFDTKKEEKIEEEPISENFTVYNDYRIYEKKMGNLTLYTVEAFDADKHRYLITFRYFPTELKDIRVEKNIYDKVLYVDENKDRYKSKIYISVNPNMSGQEAFSVFTLAQILWIGTEGHEGIYKIPTQTAFSMDYEGEDHPIKDCDDATQYIGVILVDYGDMKIFSNGYCVILLGNNLEELRMVNEKLGYILLGVI